LGRVSRNNFHTQRAEVRRQSDIGRDRQRLAAGWPYRDHRVAGNEPAAYKNLPANIAQEFDVKVGAQSKTPPTIVGDEAGSADDGRRRNFVLFLKRENVASHRNDSRSDCRADDQ
jgi:hypothetical protein